MRKSYKELEKLKAKLGVDTLWSWSRINAWHNSKYVWYLTYMTDEKPTLFNIYSELGASVHDVLEKLYSNEIEYKDMNDVFDGLWMSMYDIKGLRFNRNDEDKDKKLAIKYKKDITNFLSTHKQINGSHKLEQFLLIKIRDDIYLNGYADIIFKDGEDYVVGDWKTSTIYKGDKALNEAGQLVMYAIGLHQMKNIPFEHIKIRWNFLKYVKVTFTQNNGKVKTREIERCDLCDKIKNNVKTVMKRIGYDPIEADEYIIKMITDNDINVLPEDVLNEFTFDDCWVEVELTDELIEKWVTYVKDTVDDINQRIKKFNEDKNDHIFYDSDEDLEKQSYFLGVLSGFNLDQNKCYKEYLERVEKDKNNDLLDTPIESVNNVDEDIVNEDHKKEKVISADDSFIDSILADI